jgi:predicted nucleic acid-binding protein
MKRKSKVYLDTSVVSALFDERNPDRKELTTRFFDNIDKYEAYVSDLTISEISRTIDYNLREAMENITRELGVLRLTDEIKEIGDLYIKFGAVPEGFPEDAYHIA